MNSTIYRLNEPPRRFTIGTVFKYLTDGLAILGAVFLVTIIIDTAFFNNAGLINLIVWLWEVTN